MNEVEILYRKWLKNNIKLDDVVMISQNLKRETDYARCYVPEMEKEKGMKGRVLEFFTHNNVPIVKISTKNRKFWYSFNHVVKI